jgi:hypothetical protein
MALTPEERKKLEEFVKDLNREQVTKLKEKTCD